MDGNSNGFYHAAPPLMNQPPRIFGNLNANGSPIPPSMNGAMFGQEDLDDGHDQGDAKRRRIARVRAYV
jgi:hypothetical protein